ncbi:MAG: hypothetical protein JRD89_17810 [Deltaproteobacteria bacterium]|nr:hypothetical protein [Deltaproteobacteria bacterium]
MMTEKEVRAPVRELPSFKYRSVFLAGLRNIFSWWRADPETKEMLSTALLAKNSVVLLSGTYGVGKSTFIESVMKVFFKDIYNQDVKPTARIRDTLTEFDILLYVDIAKLRQGIEQVDARPIVTSPFIQVLQRASEREPEAL